MAPKIVERDGQIQGSARRFPSLLTSLFGRKSPITRLFPNNPITKKEFPCFTIKGSDPLDVDWVSGACMVARRTAIDQVGGFDEKFFLYWEDADLCRKMRDAGWKVIYYPEAEVYHYTGTSSDTAPLTSIFHFHKSSYLLLRKYATGALKPMMPMALVALGLRCILVMALNRFQYFVSKRM
jgi:GT2 family glycosyltransferase